MDLKDKAIDIKGKEYVLVKDRVLYFNEKYPEGSITTELLSQPDSKIVVVRATVTVPPQHQSHAYVCNVSKHLRGEDSVDRRDRPECNCDRLERTEATRTFTGHSQAVVGEGMINKTAALENAETSAVGRALALMGIGVIDSIASADELNKAKGQEDKDLAF